MLVLKKYKLEMEWPQSHGKTEKGHATNGFVWAIHSEGTGLTIVLVSCELQERSLRGQVPRQPRLPSMSFYAIYVILCHLC